MLNDGKELPTNLSWLTLTYDGDGKTAKLQNKDGSTPGPGDIASGIPIKITAFDNSIRGTKERSDNNGFIFNETLNIVGCLDNTSSCCSGKDNFCDFKPNWGTAVCNGTTNVQKCWTDPSDPYGCTVWIDQGIECSRVNSCTVAGDGTVTCTCKTGFGGDNCGCEPNCTNKNCGDDGCGGSCPNMCTSPATCGGGKPSTQNVCGYLSLVLVPGGTFNRDATYTSTVSSAFNMSETEITRTQFTAVTGLADPSITTYSSGTADPVQNVNWYHALVFCNKLSKAENLKPVYTISGSTTPADWGTVPTAANDPTWDAVEADWTANGYRLPTEMEWMWAAMGATDVTTGYTKAFAGSTGSNAIGDYAVFGYYGTEAGRTTTARTNPVRSKKANELGLYDMSGNVWEWCWDWHDTYPTEDRNDYTGPASAPASGTYRVDRGGDWVNDAPNDTVAGRGYGPPFHRDNDIGFRVVRP